MNFWQGFAPKLALTALVFAAGCGGEKDGVKELADGRAAFEVGDFKRAEANFVKSLKYAPDNVETRVYFARLKLEQGELESARTQIAAARKLDSETIDVRLLSAQIAWHLKDYELATKEFSSIAADRGLEPAMRARGWTGVGLVEMSENNLHLARIAFLRALRLDHRCASARYHLGMLYRDGFGYNEAAKEQFEVYVRLDEMASPRVQKVQRTVIPALKERILQLAAARPGVAKRDSNAAATAISKAQAAEAKGTFKNALRFYEEALKSDPLSYPAALGLAKMWQKVDATKSGQQKSFEYYKTACSLHPSSIRAFLSAGALAARLGYHAQAVEIYSRAVAASPTSLEALDGLIRSLPRVGKQTAIAQAYQRYREQLVSTRRKTREK